MKRNVRELPEFVQLAAMIGVSKGWVSHLVVWDESNRNESLLYHPEEMPYSFAEARKTASVMKRTRDLQALITLVTDGNNREALSPIPKCYWPLWPKALHVFYCLIFIYNFKYAIDN